MRPRVLRGSLLLIGSRVVALSFRSGGSVPMAVQADKIKSLRDVAAIIFGVMGAWIAIIYPKGLSNIFTKGAHVGEKRQKVRQLFAPMKYASLIVAYALLLDIAMPLVKQNHFLTHHVWFLRRCSYAALAGFAFLLLWSLLLTLLPIDNAEEEVERDAETEAGIARRQARTQKRNNK